MALFYLIRHGEPDYDAVSKIGFYGFGRSFAPLSELGVKQAEETAKDVRLLDADLIICSPYTRALQTAAIISRAIDKEIVVEPELHEWIVDKTNSITSSEEVAMLGKEFQEYKGVYPDDQEMRWETLSSLRTRIKCVADKYADYNRVIIVGHGMAFRVLKYIENIAPGEIVECEYEKGQEDCDFAFSKNIKFR
ncbi:MAG: histidine phosphatase family protein [Agathobacter sp.]|nr:histidine phosphatase family protein [Agathobacter sp.]